MMISRRPIWYTLFANVPKAPLGRFHFKFTGGQTFFYMFTKLPVHKTNDGDPDQTLRSTSDLGPD